MKNIFDGSDEPLTYGQALVLLAERVPGFSEVDRRAVTDTIRAEHDLVLPEPDRPAYTDPRDAELAELRKFRDAKLLAEAKAKHDAELAELLAFKAKADAEAAEKAAQS